MELHHIPIEWLELEDTHSSWHALGEVADCVVAALATARPPGRRRGRQILNPDRVALAERLVATERPVGHQRINVAWGLLCQARWSEAYEMILPLIKIQTMPGFAFYSDRPHDQVVHAKALHIICFALDQLDFENKGPKQRDYVQALMTRRDRFAECLSN